MADSQETLEVFERKAFEQKMSEQGKKNRRWTQHFPPLNQGAMSSPQQLQSQTSDPNQNRSPNQTQFTMGEQPDWVNVEPPSPVPGGDPVAYVRGLLEEGVASSLAKRGFAVVRVPAKVKAPHAEFAEGFKKFSEEPREYRQKFAQLQFDEAKHSPNQLHGYSEVGGLKHQLMLRVVGDGEGEARNDLTLPKEVAASTAPLFFGLDRICRNAARETVSFLGGNPSSTDAVLDPLVEPSSSDKSSKPALPADYISSSIMDNFFYYADKRSGSPGYDEPDDQVHDDAKHVSNHGAHTDSGLLTVVVTSDDPALEVLDQATNTWVAIERHVHTFVHATEGGSCRDYAIIFWGDSVCYLKDGNPGNKDISELQPSLHRVAKCEHGEARNSVVFKQRTAPLLTACRYQEDFVLAKHQLDALESWVASQPPSASASVGAGEGADSLHQVVQKARRAILNSGMTDPVCPKTSSRTGAGVDLKAVALVATAAAVIFGIALRMRAARS